VSRTVARTVSIPKGLDELTERVIRTFKMSRSQLVTVALISYLRDMGLLTDELLNK